MIRPLQRFAIQRPVATSMFYGAVVLMGLIAFSELEVNLLPDLEYPRLTAITAFPNAAPEEVENLITRPLSDSVRTVSGVREVLSESVEGLSVISVSFDWEVQVDFAAMEVREKVDQVRGILPEDSGRSIINRFDPGEAPFMEIAVFARGLERPELLRGFVRQNLKGHLDRVDGVALVQIGGGYVREIQVDVDQGRMLARGLSLADLEQRIGGTNLNFPAGSVTRGDKDVLVRTIGEYASLEDVGRTVLATGDRGAAPLRLQSIASVRDGYRDRTGLARYNGQECVLVSLKRESGRNIVRSAEAARAEIRRLERSFGQELELKIIYDQSVFINRSINNLITALLVGGVLAFIALLLILRNLRSPLILVSVIPVSLLATFILLYLRDISLNLMSLGGLALGIGMLFDSGNVVLSAIDRQLRSGLSPREAALRGGADVAGSVFAAVLTTVIVFLPVVFLKSVIGVVFEEMALTITFSLLVSMVTALTLIPMLASLDFLRGPEFDLMRFRVFRAAGNLEERIGQAYGRRLEAVLDRPARMYRVVAVLFVLALVVYWFVPRRFVPRVDTGQIEVDLEAERGSNLESTTDLVRYVETAARKELNPEHIIARVGYDSEELVPEEGGDVGKHRARIRILLDPQQGDSERAIETLREAVRPGAESRVRFHPGVDVLGSLLATEARGVALDISGDDLEVLRDLGQELGERVRRIPGLHDVSASLNQRGRELHFLPDSDRLATYGLTNEYLARYLGQAVGGMVVSRLRIGDEEIDIRLRARAGERETPESLERMRLRGEDGRVLALTQTGQIEEVPGYSSILRQGPVRINRIRAELEGTNLDRVGGAIDEVIEGIDIPEGYRIRMSGEKENVERSFRELLFAFLLAAILIYMLLSAQFESFRFALLMMGAIPLIIIGIFPALLVTGKSLNVSSFTGMILLIGIVVDNGVLLYEYTHILRGEGQALKEAIQNAGRIVLRPVLMNNATTVLALLPVALEIGEGAEFQSPMAITVISGLFTAVLLSLFVLPVFFYNRMRGQGEEDPETGAVP